MGLLGVLCFSGTPIATRVAVPAFGALTLTCARVLIAAPLAALALRGARERRPPRSVIPGLLVLGAGTAVLYPLCLGFAVEHVPAYHAAVEIALVPAATALLAAARGGERPSLSFWLASAVGVVAVIGFALRQGNGKLQLADLLLVVAILSTSAGYVEGAQVARRIGTVPALCWSLVLFAPVAAVGLAVTLALAPPRGGGTAAWGGLAYAGTISMFVGLIAWYRGLAVGGTARIGQLNLAQPLLSIVWAAALLGEHLDWTVPVTAAVVLASMVVCLRTRRGAVAVTVTSGSIPAGAETRRQTGPAASRSVELPASDD